MNCPCGGKINIDNEDDENDWGKYNEYKILLIK